jgi:hypothetical protein
MRRRGSRCGENACPEDGWGHRLGHGAKGNGLRRVFLREERACGAPCKMLVEVRSLRRRQFPPAREHLDVSIVSAHWTTPYA